MLDYKGYVAELVNLSRKAQAIAEGFDQSKADELVAAIAYACSRQDFRTMIANMLVEESGMGTVEDKIAKMYGRVKGIYHQTKEGISCGLVERNEMTGMSKYAKPMGVIGAIVPITNGEATQIIKTMQCLKGRNSIILAPHPKGAKTNVAIVKMLRSILKKFDAPEDLVLGIDPEYVSIACSGELMKQVDFVLATGGTPMVRSAYSSGTPTIGVGTGNATTFVDGTTDLNKVANMIMRSKTFDQATSCSTENNILVMDTCYEAFVEALQKQGGFMIRENTAELGALKKTLWPEWPANHGLNRQIVAQSVNRIAELAGLKLPEGTKFLVTEENEGIGEAYPFTGEKLSVVTTLIKVTSFEEALDKMEAILEYMGKGHSCGIHTIDDDKIEAMALRMKVTKMCVNQPQSLSNSGSWENGFPKSMTLGCGTWGHNSISHNVTWMDLLNFTYVSRPIPNFEPTEEELFP
ncbi:MAG: aldehyde dehydrogenase family protein, partial [Eubacteriales bacterium]|nr:aldehyde dehydrogenase family protein [Eubacteriales bacterium]